MEESPAWLFDESKQIGVDYTDEERVEEYDAQHEGFRDFKAESEKIFSALNLSKESTLLDIGCGTGGLSLQFADMCQHVYAVDVSEQMLIILARKAAEKKIRNITTAKAGFLTYIHKGEKADAVVCNISLHHLPDFWKQIALCNFYGNLKPGGKLFLGDVVFNFQPGEYRDQINGWLKEMQETAGQTMADETIVHVRDEYSTWDWVMQGMIQRAGFKLDEKTEIMRNIFGYVCSKRDGE
jgi:ubiquinone/menaquinone biosynthesis C-methylase UbiE